ncbi:carbon-nitrogen hydrolase family protein [Alkalihalobacterium elongatum]|uniref:carbon-nitrogen hydrolase family protein n=1 Tax=Alkalihalobacterium elongatum TaxID=2675466 RepID=UPI001C1F1F78|nr:carbon-nitrogen hydrolase family protein [Alkalihalobacterium elongatum]
MKKIKVALLHLLPIAGDLTNNHSLVEKAVSQAAAQNADWIVTPELVVSGLQFDHLIGTDWIKEQPDEWMNHFMGLIKTLNTTVFLGCAERSKDNELFNSVFVINQVGELVGKQQKLARIDRWSTSGNELEPINLGDVKVGILICADAYTKRIADTLKENGAEMIVAPSSWGPGLHGPNGEWEQRSIDTGLPLIVCNRTGEDKDVSFWKAESSVIINGKRILSHRSEKSAILTFEWDLDAMEPLSSKFEVEYVD